MAYSHVKYTDLKEKGFSVIKKTTYERTEDDKTVETLTSEREYNFKDPSDRKELLSIMLKHVMFGKRMEDGLEQLKEELDDLFKEIQDELPF